MGARTAFARLPTIALSLATFSYNGPLDHYTFEPIEALAQHQADVQQLEQLLLRFKAQKTEEIDFVKKAATVSAALVIGVFSWTSAESAFWVARLFWYSSLWLSVFALVSFSQQRMLDQIHAPANPNDDEHWRSLLHLFLRPAKRKRKVDPEMGDERPLLVPNRKLTWVWQNPMMLMSYSWLLFLGGYGLFFLTFLLPHSALETKNKVLSIAGIAFGALSYANLHLGSIWSHNAIVAVRKEQHTGTDLSSSLCSEKTAVEGNGKGKKVVTVAEVAPSESSQT